MTDAKNIPTYQERITSISRLAFFTVYPYIQPLMRIIRYYSYS